MHSIVETKPPCHRNWRTEPKCFAREHWKLTTIMKPTQTLITTWQRYSSRNSKPSWLVHALFTTRQFTLDYIAWSFVSWKGRRGPRPRLVSSSDWPIVELGAQPSQVKSAIYALKYQVFIADNRFLVVVPRFLIRRWLSSILYSVFRCYLAFCSQFFSPSTDWILRMRSLHSMFVSVLCSTVLSPPSLLTSVADGSCHCGLTGALWPNRCGHLCIHVFPQHNLLFLPYFLLFLSWIQVVLFLSTRSVVLWRLLHYCL